MRQMVTMGVALGLLAGFVTLSVVSAEDKDKPKHTIKEVMKKANAKDALKDKVVGGKATDAEKKELLELYTEMAKNKPPKGDEASWKKLNDALVAAAKEVVDGKETGVENLKKAVNCGACHSMHK